MMAGPPRRSGFCRLMASALLLISSLLRVDAAYQLDPQSPESIKTVAKQMADDMLSFYSGDKPGQTPGLLPQPYYWWEAGAMLGALIDYWHYTGDSSYNRLVTEGLLWQASETADYMPRNQSLTEGNDDQGFWGLAVMSAAENNYPNPPADQPQWLALAQAVFNTQAARWDENDCGGGLRWQIFHWNKGYDYKNSISQACFFALGARLALYTGNNSYAEWAERTWDWMVRIKFIDDSWNVPDGAHIPNQCTKIVPYLFTYNAGGFILGAAAMYNRTEDARWKDRLDKMLAAAAIFFRGPEKNIMTEIACEPSNTCDLDQRSFKAYLSRWLAATVKWAPHTRPVVMPYLKASAIAAAGQCRGGANGRMCGHHWSTGVYDGTTGVGQQMSAMEVILSCMIDQRAAPLTEQTGGTSKGNPAAGGDDIGRSQPRGPSYKPITIGDCIGGATLTALIIALMAAGMTWMFLDESSNEGPLRQSQGPGNSGTVTLASLSAAGGAAAVIRRVTGGGRTYSEKMAAEGSASNRRLRSSLEAHEGSENAPGQNGQGFDQSLGWRPRRLSSMPRGWPHNPSLRASASTSSAPSQ